MFSSLFSLVKGSFVIIAATTCYGLFGIFIALSKEGAEKVPYNKAATFVLAEGLKLLMSLMFLCIENRSIVVSAVHIKNLNLKHWLLFATPALMYSVSNNIDYYLLLYMDPGSAQILTQLKILTTALIWLVVFKEQLQSVQWQGLLILMVGSSLVAFGKHDGENQMYVKPMGLVFLAFQLVFSAMAGVYNEWVYKKGSGQNVSLHLQNLGMYGWGVAFQTFYFFQSKEAESNILDGFNFWTWAVVCIYAFKGLLVSQIFKHYSIIVKLLVNGAAMFVANFFTWYLFGLQTTTPHIIGLVVVFFALLRYNQGKIEKFLSSDQTQGEYEMQKLTSVNPDEYIDTESGEDSSG